MSPGLSSWSKGLRYRRQQQQEFFQSNNHIEGKLEKEGLVLDEKSKIASQSDGDGLGSFADMHAMHAVHVDMDDVPGVWCTSSHKAMVSCNQLVRQTVPLIIDVARAACNAVPRENIAALIRWKLTTTLLLGMPGSVRQAETSLDPLILASTGSYKIKKFHSSTDTIVSSTDAVSNSHAYPDADRGSGGGGGSGRVKEEDSRSIKKDGSKERSLCRDVTKKTLSEETDGVIFTREFRHQSPSEEINDASRNSKNDFGIEQCWSWSAENRETKAQTPVSLFLLVTGLVPHEGFQLLGNAPGKATPIDLTPLARPLPGMLPSYPTAVAENSK